MPDGYSGAIIETPSASQESSDNKAVVKKETFNNIVIWGHENAAGGAGDAYARSISEWIQTSERVSMQTLRIITHWLPVVKMSLFAHTRQIHHSEVRTEGDKGVEPNEQ